MRVKGVWSKYERALLVAVGGVELRILGVPWSLLKLQSSEAQRPQGCEVTCEDHDP